RGDRALPVSTTGSCGVQRKADASGGGGMNGIREIPQRLLSTRQEIDGLVERRGRCVAKAAALRAENDALRGEARAATTPGNPEAAAAAEREAQQAGRERQGLVEGARQIDADLHRIIGALGGDDLVAEGDLPVAMLPVRIETRSTPDLLQLRVRIFPD